MADRNSLEQAVAELEEASRKFCSALAELDKIINEEFGIPDNEEHPDKKVLDN